MAQSVTLSGAMIKVYFGGALLNECQSINYTIDYGETEIRGIDSAFCQEIATTQVSVKGSASVVYVQGGGGLQGKDLRSRIHEILYSPYISLRIKERKNNIDLFFCPQVKVTQESMNITAKGTVKIQFNFTGIIPYSALDLA